MKGKIDTSFMTQQRDMFASGLAAEIGMNAYGVWTAIKYHASYKTGKAWPGIDRLAELTNLTANTVRKCVKVLEEAHLLRVTSKPGKTNIYVARERLDVRIGNRLICTVLVDYVPERIRNDLQRIEAAFAGTEDQEVLAQVDIIPGPGFAWNIERGVLQAQIPAKELPTAPATDIVDEYLSNKLKGMEAAAKARPSRALVDKSKGKVAKD